MKNILFLGTQDFSNSLEEVKDFFDFKLTFKENDIDKSIIDNYNCVIIEDKIEKNENIFKHLNNTNVSKLVITVPIAIWTIRSCTTRNRSRTV